MSFRVMMSRNPPNPDLANRGGLSWEAWWLCAAPPARPTMRLSCQSSHMRRCAILPSPHPCHISPHLSTQETGLCLFTVAGLRALCRKAKFMNTHCFIVDRLRGLRSSSLFERSVVRGLCNLCVHKAACCCTHICQCTPSAVCLQRSCSCVVCPAVAYPAVAVQPYDAPSCTRAAA